jgi:hypothetical protein
MSAMYAAIAWTRCYPATHGRADAGTRTSGNSRIGAKHSDTRTKLRSSKRNHMLADVSGNDLSMLRICMGEYVLNQVVAILITGNID